MKKAGILILILLTQFYMLPYRALYIYCAANHVSLAALNAYSQDNQNVPNNVKFSLLHGTSIGSTHPPKHNDRFANVLSAITVTYNDTNLQEVFIQELLPAKQQHNCYSPLVLPNSSRGSPLV